MGLRRWLAGGKSHSSQTTPSQTNNTLSLSEVQVGALAVRRRLGTQDLDLNAPVTASCNSDLYLPAGCKVTPLGYAVLSAQHDLLAMLLQQGADPNKHVGLPHRFNLTPLHVAVVRDDPTAVSLLLANGAAANAPLDRKSGASGPPASSMRESSTTKSSSSSSTQQPVFAQVMHALWSPGPDSHWRRVDQGDTALHLAVATSNTEALRALLDSPSTDVNRSSPAGRTPLSMACELEHLQLARMLVQHPRIDVNAGGPIFTSIKVLSEPLLQLLLDAGASLTAVNAERLTPLRFAVLRATEGNTNLAEIVKQLLRSGAVPDPECRKHAKRQGWPRVEAALENAHLIAPQQPASAAPGGWAPPPAHHPPHGPRRKAQRFQRPAGHGSYERHHQSSSHHRRWGPPPCAGRRFRRRGAPPGAGRPRLHLPVDAVRALPLALPADLLDFLGCGHGHGRHAGGGVLRGRGAAGAGARADAAGGLRSRAVDRHALPRAPGPIHTWAAKRGGRRPAHGRGWDGDSRVRGRGRGRGRGRSSSRSCS